MLVGLMDDVTRVALEKFSPRQVSDIALLSAYYTAAGALIIGLGVRLEPPKVLQIELDWRKRNLAAR